MTNLEANRIARTLGRKGYDTEIKDLDGFGLDKAVRVSVLLMALGNTIIGNRSFA